MSNSPAIDRMRPASDRANVGHLPDQKFSDPMTTVAGEARAHVALKQLSTLWINTGTLCNITCRNCYIESSPSNDRLAYITTAEVLNYLDEIADDALSVEEIGFTGGEPFMNAELIAMLDVCLARDFKVLVLTNGMRPMQRCKASLLDLHRRYGRRLTVRVSLDHYTAALHEEERGPGHLRSCAVRTEVAQRSGFPHHDRRPHHVGRGPVGGTRWLSSPSCTTRYQTSSAGA